MSNAFDAQTAWQTKNAIAGAFNLLNVNSTNGSDASSSGSGSVRGGYTPPTPQTNSSNARNSGLPSNFGTQTIPHDFSLLGGPKGNEAIKTGVYYHLIPKKAGGSNHPQLPEPLWFPVTGDSHVDFTFSHQWDQADNLAKKVLGSVASGVGGDVGDLAFKQAQHLLGGGVYVSGCSVYNSSAPPTITVATKLFAVGSGNLISILEALRFDTHARRGGGNAAANLGKTISTLSAGGIGADAATQVMNGVGEGSNALAKAAGGKAGSIDHPGWWKIEVISFAGEGSNEGVVACMDDMICTGLKATMYSPWIGIEPSFMELRIDFQHAFPGLAESMKFGSRI